MILEVIRESDELEHFLLSRALGKVEDLQALLWSEWGARCGDEVTDLFHLLETQFCFPRVNRHVQIAKAIKHFVDVDLAYFIDQAVKGLALHIALKVKLAPFSPLPSPVVITMRGWWCCVVPRCSQRMNLRLGRRDCLMRSSISRWLDSCCWKRAFNAARVIACKPGQWRGCPGVPRWEVASPHRPGSAPTRMGCAGLVFRKLHPDCSAHLWL